jgi:hypothetical protein
MIDVAAIKARFGALAPVLDECGRRLFAASKAQTASRGGVVTGGLLATTAIVF